METKPLLTDVLLCYNVYFVYLLFQLIRHESCSTRGSVKVCREVFTWWFVDFAYCVAQRIEEKLANEQREQLVELFYSLGALFVSGRIVFHVTLTVLF